MHQCPSCRSVLEVSGLRCTACAIEVSGRFMQCRLARLSPDHLRLAEELVLVGGNLKELAKRQSLSYPTLRKRVDSLIAELGHLRDEDRQRSDAMLAAVERGDMDPEEATRMIKELNGGA